jgi:hypothetical protein
MNKNLFVIVIIICLSVSCQTASYVHDIESTPYGVDFRNGKWLLNKIESPEVIKQKLTKIIFDGFSKHLGDKLYDINNIISISLSYVPINPDTLLLKRLKKESQFDYLINVKANSIRDDLGLSASKFDYLHKNIAETVLEIYDLNTLEIIYSRKVTGSISIDESNNRDFIFTKGVNGIMISGLKKIMKKIR